MMRAMITVGIVACCLLPELYAAPADNIVEASQFFAVGDTTTIIYIETGADEVLRFQAADNDKYHLHGKRLEIRAVSVQVDGAVEIRAFGPTEGNGADQTGVGAAGANYNAAGGGCGDYHIYGCNGRDGGQGGGGSAGGNAEAAKSITLLVDHLLGDGTLTVVSSGGHGGRGGTGGQGGKGEDGGRGSDRNCSTACGNGGTGGAAGRGGDGGPGGRGGNAAPIYYGPPLQSFVGGRLILVTSGGKGGGGGQKGAHGARGEAGQGGSGNSCGGGCTPGSPGPAPDGSYDGQSGLPGSDGADAAATLISSQR